MSARMIASRVAAAALSATMILSAFHFFGPRPAMSLDGDGRGTANLSTINSSGVTGSVSFEDDGTRLYASGTASGFVPERRYFSLVYGVKSAAPGEPGIPCGRDDTLNFEQMLLGEWLPAGATTRNLVMTPSTAPQPKLTVGLEQIRTVSIRQLTAPLLPDVTKDFPPQAFELRACGLIAKTGTGGAAPAAPAVPAAQAGVGVQVEAQAPGVSADAAVEAEAGTGG